MAKNRDSNASQREKAKQQNLERLLLKQMRQEVASKVVESGRADEDNVCIPTYTYDKQLNVYREVMPPH